MRLYEVIERKRLTPEELEFALSLVKDDIMTQSELSSRIKDAVVDYPRNANSLRMLAPRMYTLVHGELPLDKTDDAGWFKDLPETMVRFLQAKGYDVADNLRRARINLRNRRRNMTRADYINLANEYIRGHEHMLQRDVTKKRDRAVDRMMKGAHIDMAFRPYYVNETMYRKVQQMRLIENNEDDKLQQLVRAVMRVWEQIAYDIPMPEVSSKEMVELAADANRLLTFGYEEEEKILQDYIRKIGYDLTYKAITKLLPYDSWEAGGSQL